MSLLIPITLSAGLGLLVGIFLGWLRARYGATERTYIIYGITGLAGMAVVFLVDKHRQYDFNCSGIYLIALLLTPRLVKP